MIVIEHGRTYDMITCVHCKAVLGYTLKDIKKDYKAEEYAGDLHTHETEYITCPECNRKTYLKYLIDGKET